MVHHRSANDLMEFMAMISLQLGLFNLLPIPILDGGLIAMLLVESVMRRDINEAIKIRPLPGGIRLPGVVCGHGDLQTMYEDAPGQ